VHPNDLLDCLQRPGSVDLVLGCRTRFTDKRLLPVLSPSAGIARPIKRRAMYSHTVMNDDSDQAAPRTRELNTGRK
ncbi:MAG: hypothetical protein SNJ75_14225, partial [Gemmataceae bacterium]